MTSPDPRDAAIEKAAEAIWNSNPERLEDWENTRRACREAFLPVGRAAYDAIAPLVLLAAADDISENHYLLLPVGADVGDQLMPDNWLRDRAAAIVRGDAQPQ